MARITITTENLGKRFNREWIFRNLSFTFQPGQVYAVTGPNGSGKSTLLQVLWGQVPQSLGSLRYQIDQNELPVEDVYKHVAIAAPYLDLIEEFTLLEQLNFHFKLKQKRYPISIDEMLERMYLMPARNKQILNFSSGMRQRVKLALAFFTAADIVFLDEPGTNLDKTAFEWYKNQLATLDPSNLIFIASNNPEEYPEDARIFNIQEFKR